MGAAYLAVASTGQDEFLRAFVRLVAEEADLGVVESARVGCRK